MQKYSFFELRRKGSELKETMVIRKAEFPRFLLLLMREEWGLDYTVVLHNGKTGQNT
jgi:hypothetical protein